MPQILLGEGVKERWPASFIALCYLSFAFTQRGR